MFEINDVVVHYRDGLAKITGVTEMNGNEFFVLMAKRGDGTTFYVPKANASKTIRPIMDIENADGILAYMSALEVEFNPNTKQRRDDFKRRIASGNILDVAYLVKQLYLYNHTEELPPKVKFGPVDFNILNEAKNLLFDELSVIYHVDEEKLPQFIEERIKNI